MKRVFIWFINLYQSMPLSSHNMCRYTPSCSEYMKISIVRFGCIKGLYLGIKRICKCRPHGGSGYDPVPEKEKI